MKTTDQTVSVVVTNHNYARFLADAIDSALAQSHPATEVVVVDDASADASREVMGAYGDRITPVLLDDRVDQVAAFTAGFARTRGELVCALDADDVLLPTAVETAVALAAQDASTVCVLWPLIDTDATGTPTGLLSPRRKLRGGMLRDELLANGPGASVKLPCAGAWSRAFLEQVLPGPPMTLGLDAYLSALAPLFGTAQVSDRPHGTYRRHGTSSYAGQSSDSQLATSLEHDEVIIDELARWCAKLGHPANRERWRTHSWWSRVRTAVDELEHLIPPAAPFILVDEARWNLDRTDVRRPLPFLERDGEYWGPPANSGTAERELVRMRADGAEFLVFAWPAFWWCDEYPEFIEWVKQRYRCTTSNERIVVFDLRNEVDHATASETGSGRA